ncbi:MAG: TerB family tellurite resistance protein [Bdellovibrionota bacterium]
MGKILCALIGYSILGKFGLIIGLILGHLVDSEETYGSLHRRKPTVGPFPFQRPQRSLEEKHLTFFNCVFSMLSKLAKADGAISASEIQVVERFMSDELHLDPGRIKFAQNVFRSARLSNRSFEDYAKEFYAMFRYEHAVLENLIDILLRLSLADGKMENAEERLVRSAAAIFGFNDRDFERIRSRYTSQPDKNYSILGCTPQSSVAEIKKRYRKLAKENHPDAVRAQGQPEEFIKLANEKFRAIQQAYEEIRAEKGFA